MALFGKQPQSVFHPEVISKLFDIQGTIMRFEGDGKLTKKVQPVIEATKSGKIMAAWAELERPEE